MAKATCKLCRSVIVHLGGTTDLKHHLRNDHDHEYSELFENHQQTTLGTYTRALAPAVSTSQIRNNIILNSNYKSELADSFPITSILNSEDDHSSNIIFIVYHDITIK